MSTPKALGILGRTSVGRSAAIPRMRVATPRSRHWLPQLRSSLLALDSLDHALPAIASTAAAKIVPAKARRWDEKAGPYAGYLSGPIKP